jgi:hypothetical protein
MTPPLPQAETSAAFALIALITDPVAAKKRLDDIVAAAERAKQEALAAVEKASAERAAAISAQLDTREAAIVAAELRNDAEAKRLEALRVDLEGRFRKFKEYIAAA